MSTDTNNDDNNKDKQEKSLLECAAQAVGDNVKGVIQATKNYSIVLNDRTSAVNIIDNVAKKWFLRIDNAHKNVNFKHINVNKKITGIPDPHTAISGTAFHAAENTAWFCKQANAVLAPAAIAIDAARTVTSAYEDYKKGTVRNTMATASSITGGWGGGFAGAQAGAAIGSMLLPGVGTIAGAIIGGMGGGIGGAVAAEKITDVVADKVDLNIERMQCWLCQEDFECRLYTDQCREFCPECIKMQMATESLECFLCLKKFDCKIFTFQHQELCPECVKEVLSRPPVHDQCRELCRECVGKLLTTERLQCLICQEMFDCRIYTDQRRELCPNCVERVQSGEIEIQPEEGSEESSDEEEWFDS